jgi:O-antigen/teichoic acid export membrane protein
MAMRSPTGRRFKLNTWSPFSRGIALVSAGTAAGHLVVAATSPLLTRMYAPNDFGVFAVFLSLLLIGATIACLRYELTISLARDDETAASLVYVSLLAALSTGVLSVAGVWGFRGILANVMHTPSLREYLWILPLAITLAGAYSTFSYWSIRRQSHGLLGMASAGQSTAQSISQLGLGLTGMGPEGLMFGVATGHAASAIGLAGVTWRRDRNLFKTTSIARLLRSARRYRRFPLVSTASALLNSSGLYIAPVLVAAFYGTRAAGWMALAQRIVGIPMALLGQSVAQVYLGDAAARSRDDLEGMRRLFVSTAKRMLALALPPAMLLVLVGPQLFAFVFGEAWRASGEFARVLTSVFVAQLVAVPVSQTLNILERLGIQLAWDATRLALVVLSIALSQALGWTSLGAVASFSAAMTVCYIGNFLLSLHAIRAELRRGQSHPAPST